MYKEMNRFNGSQLEEIRLGIETGLDVTLYAKPEYDSSQMSILRMVLENRINKNKDFSFEDVCKLINALINAFHDIISSADTE